MDKQQWRRAIRAARAARPVAAQRSAAADLARVALAEPAVATARTVVAYLPLSGEPDVAPLISALRDRGATVALPRVEPHGLSFGEYTGELREGAPTARGLRIPEPTGRPVPLATADLLLLPALAVDRLGVRLGQGGGYYDRTELDGPTLLAVVFEDEFVERLPEEPHDTRAHGVLTPAGVTWVSSPSRSG